MVNKNKRLNLIESNILNNQKNISENKTISIDKIGESFDFSSSELEHIKETIIEFVKKNKTNINDFMKSSLNRSYNNDNFFVFVNNYKSVDSSFRGDFEPKKEISVSIVTKYGKNQTSEKTFNVSLDGLI
jgi:hypothetical protein